MSHSSLNEDDKVHFILPDPIGPPKEHEPVACLLNGKPVPFHKLSGARANQLGRWQLLYKDLEFAEAQLDVLFTDYSTTPAALMSGTALIATFQAHDKKGMVTKALLDSAMMSYVKCFAEATKGRKVKLEAVHVFSSKKGKRMRKTHNLAMKFRYDYLAHAGTSRYETSATYAILNPTHGPTRGVVVVVARTSFNYLDHQEVTDFLELVRFVKDWAQKHINEKIDLLRADLHENPGKYGMGEILTRPSNDE